MQLELKNEELQRDCERMSQDVRSWQTAQPQLEQSEVEKLKLAHERSKCIHALLYYDNIALLSM